MDGAGTIGAPTGMATESSTTTTDLTRGAPRFITETCTTAADMAASVRPAARQGTDLRQELPADMAMPADAAMSTTAREHRRSRLRAIRTRRAGTTYRINPGRRATSSPARSAGTTTEASPRVIRRGEAPAWELPMVAE